VKRRVILLLLALFASSRAASAADVELRVRHVGAAPSGTNSVEITALNWGPGEAFFFTYTSAFALPDGRSTGRWFTIKDAFGNEAPYRGRWVLTRGEDADSYTRLAEGQEIRAVVDLGMEYELPTASPVSVRTSLLLMDRLPSFNEASESESVPTYTVESNTETFFTGTSGSKAATRAGN